MTQREAIDLLADHFTGGLVAHQSICLELGGPHSAMAKRFFRTREALGIRGYASKEEATATLAEKLGIKLDS